MTVEPHGGGLVDRTREPPEDVDELPRLEIDRSTYMDLEMLATGAYSPLKGFVTHDDFRRVVEDARLADGTAWGLPISLAVDEEPEYTRHALVFDGSIVGSVYVEECWRKDATFWAEGVYGTTDDDHPGVERVHGLGSHLVGGEVELYRPTPEKSYERRYTPREARDEFDRRGWRSVVGFQTRNPPHRAHEYLQKCALETADGVFVHPLVGTTKDADVDAGVRMHAYRVLLDEYYSDDHALLGTLKAPMRYGGPREALFHALVRQNYGCSRFVVGRDHAGVGDHYSSYEAHDFLREFEDEIAVQPLYYDYAFYCHDCDGMATDRTCGHSDDARENPSGTRIRRTARRGGDVSPKLMRPVVWEVVRDELRGQEERESAASPRTGGPTGGAS